MSDEELEALMARVQDLEDRNAILDTLAQYGHSLDYGDFDKLVDCFTHDAVRENRRPDGSVNRWVGREGTLDFARRHSHAPELYHKHLVLNSRIQLHGDTADVQSYMFRFDAGDGERSYVWGLGRYIDTMRREPDGRWRIAHRVSEIEDQWPGRFVLKGHDNAD
ncbi:hypothetical protein BH11ACT4_BH11ACT4_24970 [soil metagenome]